MRPATPADHHLSSTSRGGSRPKGQVCAWQGYLGGIRTRRDLLGPDKRKGNDVNIQIDLHSFTDIREMCIK